MRLSHFLSWRADRGVAPAGRCSWLEFRHVEDELADRVVPSSICCIGLIDMLSAMLDVGNMETAIQAIFVAYSGTLSGMISYSYRLPFQSRDITDHM
jgi:hypothetical protein